MNDDKNSPNSLPVHQDIDVNVYEAQVIYELPKDLQKILDSENPVDMVDDDTLADLINGIEEDRQTMKPYLERYDVALKLAKMDDEKVDKNFPFQGASRVMMPYVMEAALDFWARTTPEVVERKNIAQAEIFSKEDQETVARGDRISDFTNYDLRKGISNWRDDQSKALLSLPITGMYYKKIWYDPSTGSRRSQLIQPDELICDHTKASFKDCPRKSFEYTMTKSEVRTAILIGQFIEFDYGEDDDTRDDIEFIESHCLLDLDGDGCQEPYVVTIAKESSEVVSVSARFDVSDVTLTEDSKVVSIDGEALFTLTIYIPDPGGSFLGMGWGVLLCDMFHSMNSITRQLIDAGTLQNTAMNSGFISVGRGLGPNSRSRKGSFDLEMGKFKALEADNLGQSIWQPSFNGPSSTLFQLLESLKVDTRNVVSTIHNVESNPGEAAELYLARLSQAQKLPNAIKINVFSGITGDLLRLQEIYRDYLTNEEYSMVVGEGFSFEQDFDENYISLCLTADPAQGSDEERVARAKIVLEEAKQNPVHNLREAYNRYYSALGVRDPEQILPEPQPQQPDPLAVMQAQSMERISKAEELSSQAKMMSSMASMMKVRVEMFKLDSEIKKTESETLKNLSQVDKNERELMLKTLKQDYENLRGVFDDARKIFETDQSAVAISTEGQRVQGDSSGLPQETFQ